MLIMTMLSVGGYPLFLGKTVFASVQTNGEYTAPSGTQYLWVKAWGAGGGGADNNPGLGNGGSGGFVRALLDVRSYPKDFRITIGVNAGRSHGNAGQRGAGFSCAAGGGYSALFTNTAVPLVIAGGGGGGSPFSTNYSGGSGGYPNGGQGGSGSSSRTQNGGDQSSGGATTSSSDIYPGQAGSYLQGGNPASLGGKQYSGGGGGYYGGAGAGGNESLIFGSGGGGSSYYLASVASQITASAATGDRNVSPSASSDSDHVVGIGKGGLSSPNLSENKGGAGRLVIYAYSRLSEVSDLTF